jgi:hypothetical protein
MADRSNERMRSSGFDVTFAAPGKPLHLACTKVPHVFTVLPRNVSLRARRQIQELGPREQHSARIFYHFVLPHAIRLLGRGWVGNGV